MEEAACDVHASLQLQLSLLSSGKIRITTPYNNLALNDYHVVVAQREDPDSLDLYINFLLVQVDLRTALPVYSTVNRYQCHDLANID